MPRGSNKVDKDLIYRKEGLAAVPEGYSYLIADHAPPPTIDDDATCVHEWKIMHRGTREDDGARGFVWRTATVHAPSARQSPAHNVELMFAGSNERVGANLRLADFGDGAGRG